MAPSDRDLMHRIQQRDAAAFDALWHRYAARLRGFLTRTVRDASVADDLTQEAFMRVWTRAEQWQGRGPLKAWLFRMATNLALNHLRSVRRRRQRPLEIPARDMEQEEHTTPGWLIDLWNMLLLWYGKFSIMHSGMTFSQGLTRSKKLKFQSLITKD